MRSQTEFVSSDTRARRCFFVGNLIVLPFAVYAGSKKLAISTWYVWGNMSTGFAESNR